jgi:hypothetical protein
MKKVIVALLMLTLIVTAGILEHNYIEKTFTELDKKLNAIIYEINFESDNALTLTNELVEWWEKKRKVMELFTFSPDLRAFSVALAEQKGSLECGDFNNALSKCVSLLSISKNLHDVLDFNVQDII